MNDVVIAGVGMHKFGRFEDKSYTQMGQEAVLMALKDANIPWRDIPIAFCSEVNLPITAGFQVLWPLGMTGIPVIDVECACASGGAAIKMAYMAIASGQYPIALAFGVEKMPRGFINMGDLWANWQMLTGLSIGPMYWAMWARRHMAEYGTTMEQLCKVSWKNHRNGVHNPYAMYQKEFSMEEINNSRMIVDPIRLLNICAPNEGAAAAVLCAGEVAKKYTNRVVKVAASTVVTSQYPQKRLPAYSISAKISGSSETEVAAKQSYEMAGIGPKDLDLVELQDTDAFQEILYSEELGLCERGEGGLLVDEGATEIGGRIPINPSGGLLSKGEPVGASHLGQIAELVWQLRGEAGRRQVANPKVGLAHVVGASGYCAITVLTK